MSRPTERYKRSFSSSVGAGMKSVFGNEGRRYYVLEHKVSSKYHKAGESQKIIIDQIELGRAPECQVRFDEAFNTVSRRHAAIVKNGDNWKLVQLSKMNTTYLNGRPVEKEWYLQNGDEIQLSANGPKLGFIVPQGEKGLVKSIGMTARLNLFRQQALRPYKQAITALACVFLLCMSVGGYVMYEQHQENIHFRKALADAEEESRKEKARIDALIDSLATQNKDIKDKYEAGNEVIRRMQNRIDEIGSRPPVPIVNPIIDNEAINACLPHILFIAAVKFDITLPTGERASLIVGEEDSEGKRIGGWTGTGFLLNNGKFVTARHVAEAWFFWKDGSGMNKRLWHFNLIANNGGKTTAHFIAVSSSGLKMTFTSDQFACNRSNDKSNYLEDGTRYSLAQLDHTDFAYFQTNSGNGLSFDSHKSSRLERGAKLTVLGFPLGLGVNAIDDINPIYGSGIVAAPGLQDGRIITTDTNYEQGNSGGPVFYTDNSGKMVVVGIVSAGAGRSTGFIVPISVVQ